MILIKRWIRDFFGLPQSQVNGFIVLVPLLGLFLISEPIWHAYVASREDDFSNDRRILDSLIALWDHEDPDILYSDEQNHKTAVSDLFLFDPNTASSEGLQSLGFSPFLSGRIANYRNKGGKFTVKKDLLKIYGLDTSFYHKLHPFIDLPETIEYAKKEFEPDKHRETPKVRDKLSKFDLNEADTSHLKKIYGIGDKLSVRIVRYRDALGGFITHDQVAEVYGLDSTVLKRLRETAFISDEFEPEKLNINTADENSLAVHPYLRKVARSIVTYRFQHGKFNTLDDLRKIHAIDEKTIEKMEPYLRVDE